jgi:hypothetical protein
MKTKMLEKFSYDSPTLTLIQAAVWSLGQGHTECIVAQLRFKRPQRVLK